MGSAAAYFHRQSGGDACRLLRVENKAPWLRTLSMSRWKVEADWEKFAVAWRRSVEEQFALGGMLHLLHPPTLPPASPAAPTAAVSKAVPKAAPQPLLKKGLLQQDGSYTNIRFLLRHFRGELATEQRGSNELNVCPWSKLEAASHCAWRAGKHLRQSHLRPKDLLDHLGRVQGSDPAQREQALTMIKDVVPGGLVGYSQRPEPGQRNSHCPQQHIPRGRTGHRCRRR